MSDFTPVTSLEDLATLDADEMMMGYLDGFYGFPEPGNNLSRSYWHGWRNGAVDSKRRDADEAQLALARDVYARSSQSEVA